MTVWSHKNQRKPQTSKNKKNPHTPTLLMCYIKSTLRLVTISTQNAALFSPQELESRLSGLKSELRLGSWIWFWQNGLTLFWLCIAKWTHVSLRQADRAVALGFAVWHAERRKNKEVMSQHILLPRTLLLYAWTFISPPCLNTKGRRHHVKV